MDASTESPQLARPSTYPCHHAFNQSISNRVAELKVRNKRDLYARMRRWPVTPESFFPVYGLSAADFTTFEVVNANVRRATTAHAASNDVKG